MKFMTKLGDTANRRHSLSFLLILAEYKRSVVKLVKNYRSHEAILRFPNDRFYGGDLQPCGDPQVVNSYLRSSHLPNKKFPIVFHALSGKDDREASSPSFFNIDEVTQVKAYVEALRHDRQFRISGSRLSISHSV